MRPLDPPRTAASDQLGALRSRTVPADDEDAFEFLARHAGAPRSLYWHEASGVAGAGVAAEILAHSARRFEEVQRAAREVASRLDHERAPGVPQGLGPRWLGGFAFEPATGDAVFPAARFVLPRQELTVHDGRAYLTTTGPEDPGAAPEGEPNGSGSAAIWRNEPGFDAWAVSVRAALDAVRRGEVQKVVLARAVTARLARRPRLPRLLRALATRSPASRVLLVEPEPGHAFLAASPELLVSRRGGVVRTTALAGSRARGRTDAEDEALARSLRSSSKEAWEHELVARFLRSVLERRGRAWSTPVERGVLRLPHVQHLETRFESDAVPEESVIELARVLHPTPAVGGAPRDAALTLLQRLEARPRGWYAGAVGWFDAAGDGEFAVGIRCAEVRDRALVLRAGCGIVEGSDPAEEWAESRAKLQLLMDAFDAEAGP